MAAARHSPGSVLIIPVGVVVVRETVAHPWKDQLWRPVSVTLDPEPGVSWRELHRSDSEVQYLVGIWPITLRPRESVGYRINLANGEPTVYVVLRDTPSCASGWPVEVRLVTASPLEVQDLGNTDDESVHRVPMPDALLTLIRTYVDEYRTVDRHA